MRPTDFCNSDCQRRAPTLPVPTDARASYLADIGELRGSRRRSPLRLVAVDLPGAFCSRSGTLGDLPLAFRRHANATNLVGTPSRDLGSFHRSLVKDAGFQIPNRLLPATEPLRTRERERRASPTFRSQRSFAQNRNDLELGHAPKFSRNRTCPRDRSATCQLLQAAESTSTPVNYRTSHEPTPFQFRLICLLSASRKALGRESRAGAPKAPALRAVGMSASMRALA